MATHDSDDFSPDRAASHHDSSGQDLDQNLDENMMDQSGESEEPIGNQVLTPIEKRRVALSILLHVTEDDLTSPDLPDEEPGLDTLPELGENPDELVQATHESDKDSDEELSDAEPNDDKQQELIEAAMNKRYSLLKTAELKKRKTQNRKDMDAVGETYFTVYDELKKLRNLYLQKAQDHRHMMQELNIRETLQIEGKLKRPLTEDQVASLKGMKIKVLRTRKIEIKKGDEEKPSGAALPSFEEKEDEEFRKISFDMMKESQYESKNRLDMSDYNIAILHTARYRCELCTKVYKTKHGLTTHLREHTGQAFVCQWCPDKKYRSEKSFKQHMRFHVDGDKLYICTYGACGKQFENKQHWKTHERTHEPPDLPCRQHPDCKAMFRFNSQRRRHEMQSDAYPFLCTKCYQGYKKKGGLDRHTQLYHSFGVAPPKRAATATATGPIVE